jgi:hypothetical protein
MSQQLVLELSDEVYTALQEQANAAGLSIEEWLVTSLSQQYPSLTPANTSNLAQQDDGMARLLHYAGAIQSNGATGSDNASIDADLAKAYANEFER